MTPISICRNTSCGTVIFEEEVFKCPKCGGPMEVRRKSRPLGWVMLTVGWPLALVMGSSMVVLARSLLNPGMKVAGNSFSGTAQEGRISLELLALLTLIGLIATFLGIERIATGRKRLLAKLNAFGLIAIALVVTWVRSAPTP
jgi:predicted RNA-binding Zn-ribbon protein involved in translation (DUF1610 family)